MAMRPILVAGLAVAALLSAACRGVPAAPTGVPAAPTGVAAIAAIGAATVTWTAPADGGAPITAYKIWVSDGGDFAVAPADQGSQRAVVTGLRNGATYRFKVQAVNAVGAGTISAPSAAITLPDVPRAPTAVVADAIAGSVALSWTAPDDGGSPITGYFIWQSAGADFVAAQATVSGQSALVTNLADGAPYRFMVEAVNAVGAGALSAVTEVTATTVPAAAQIAVGRAIVTAGDAGLTAQATSAAATAFAWTISGGTITSAQGSVVTFTAGAPGMLTLTCRAIDAAGSSLPGTAAVTVVAAPAIQSFTASSGSTAAGATVLLTANFTGGDGAVAPGVGAVASGAPATSPVLHDLTTFNLVVTNAAGARATASIEVAVTPFSAAAAAMKSAREAETATLLPSGEILLVGGVGSSGYLASAELWDRGGGGALTGSLHAVRYQHTATLLHDGTVLIAGGRADGGGPLGSPFPRDVETYDAASGQFTLIHDGLATGRTLLQAALLPDGRVLLAGGFGDDGHGCCIYLASAEVFDPAAHAASATGSLVGARYQHTATALADGRVLIAGGFYGTAIATAELYDPAHGLFSATGAMRTARFGHAAVRLHDGRVLVMSGLGLPFASGGAGGTLTATAELFDPGTGHFAPTGSLHIARNYPAAVVLPDGRVLVAGGEDDQQAAYDTAEIYDPATGAFALLDRPFSARRSKLAAALLPDGFAALFGGFNGTSGALATVDVY